jgi:hypothetical protein
LNRPQKDLCDCTPKRHDRQNEFLDGQHSPCLAFLCDPGYPIARQEVAPFHKGRIIMAKAKAPASEKREYKTPESAAKQKAQWEQKGYKVTRKGNILYVKKVLPII